MSAYNNYFPEEWFRVGVPENRIVEWDILDFDLDLEQLPPGALYGIPPREIWFWERQGYSPQEAVAFLREGRTLGEVVSERFARAMESLDARAHAEHGGTVAQEDASRGMRSVQERQQPTVWEHLLQDN